MPELPEVEVVRRGIEKKVIAESAPKILDFHFQRKDLREAIPIKKFTKLKGARLTAIDRRAKYLIFKTTQGSFLSHLGMSGHWRLQIGPKNQVFAGLIKHDHILIEFERESFLIYNDPRRFGFFETIDVDDDQKHFRFQNLAPEPFSNEFTAEFLHKELRKKNVSIKSAIMDQGLVVGVGNIYASEVLFASRIRPQRICSKISKVECEKIVTNIRLILQKSINEGGSSISNFFNADGEKGSYQQNHQVYDREGHPCPSGCGEKIRMKVLSGRSSFWCPRCQK